MICTNVARIYFALTNVTGVQPGACTQEEDQNNDDRDGKWWGPVCDDEYNSRMIMRTRAHRTSVMLTQLTRHLVTSVH